MGAWLGRRADVSAPGGAASPVKKCRSSPRDLMGLFERQPELGLKVWSMFACDCLAHEAEHGCVRILTRLRVVSRGCLALTDQHGAMRRRSMTLGLSRLLHGTLGQAQLVAAGEAFAATNNARDLVVAVVNVMASLVAEHTAQAIGTATKLAQELLCQAPTDNDYGRGVDPTGLTVTMPRLLEMAAIVKATADEELAIVVSNAWFPFLIDEIADMCGLLSIDIPALDASYRIAACCLDMLGSAIESPCGRVIVRDMLEALGTVTSVQSYTKLICLFRNDVVERACAVLAPRLRDCDAPIFSDPNTSRSLIATYLIMRIVDRPPDFNDQTSYIASMRNAFDPPVGFDSDSALATLDDPAYHAKWRAAILAYLDDISATPEPDAGAVRAFFDVVDCARDNPDYPFRALAFVVSQHCCKGPDMHVFKEWLTATTTNATRALLDAVRDWLTDVPYVFAKLRPFVDGLRGPFLSHQQQQP